MPVTNSLIDDITCGDTYTLARSITNLPAGVTVSTIRFAVKQFITQLDAESILFKTITGFASANGQITNSGGSGTAVFQVLLSSADTRKLTPDIPWQYDVQASGSDGSTRTVEIGLIQSRADITQSS